MAPAPGGKRNAIPRPPGRNEHPAGAEWRLWSEALDGVLVFAPDGSKIGRIALPERCANVCFGGTKRNRLFMAASQSLYSLYVNTQGVAGG